MTKSLLGCIGAIIGMTLLLGIQFAIVAGATWLVCLCLGTDYLWRYAITANVLVVLLNMLVLGWRKAR